MKFLFLLSLFPVFSICTSFSVENINIIGNDHTQFHIIQRELHHPIPGEFDSTMAVKDRDRIYNLGLFSTVEIKQIDSLYTIFLVETFRFLPIPIMDYNEAKGWSYGGGIAFLNIKGYNQKLTFGGIIGEEITYFIDFKNPWIIGNHVSLSGAGYQFSTQNPVYDYHYKERGINVGTGFYINNIHKFNFLVGIESVWIDTCTMDKKNIRYIDEIYSKYQYLRGDFSYRYDKRNIYLDPTSGNLLNLYLKPKYSLDEGENYFRLQIDNYQYIQLFRGFLNPVLILKTKIYLQQSKSLPIFAYQYMGGEEFVRGYSPLPKGNPEEISHLIEGFNIFYNSFQIQHTLLKKKNFHRIELGVDMVYFADWGISANKVSSFKLKNTIFGFGFGFRFFASGSGVIGIDFGFNPFDPYDQPFIHLSDS